MQLNFNSVNKIFYIIKKIIISFFWIIALIINFWFRINSLLVGKKRAFMSSSQFISLFPGIFGIYLRSLFYYQTLLKSGVFTHIEFLTTFVTQNTCIGNNVYIGSHCNISSCHIGDDCLFGSGVMVTSGQNQHFYSSRDVPIRLQGGKKDLIKIGRDCWVGNGAIIMANLGEGCVVAAGSVVTNSIPAYSIVAGVPAKIIGTR